MAIAHRPKRCSGGKCVLEGCRLPGFGAHEVVVETPAHDVALADLPAAQVECVLRAYRDRVRAFKADSRFQYVQLFKNHGNAAGASMTHSHSQLLALPIVPRAAAEQLDEARSFHERNNGACVFCRLVKHETEEDTARLIDRNKSFVAVAPFAPRFAYETWIIPAQRHVSNFECSTDEELTDLAEILKRMLQRINKALDTPPYNYVIDTAPLQDDEGTYTFYDWHMRIVPHLVEMGGFELGSGCHINSTLPEEAAEVLRNVQL
eukprot:SM000138S00070  [mRNA]  locus=s138:288496:290629:- [translate_table: standard]